MPSIRTSRRLSKYLMAGTSALLLAGCPGLLPSLNTDQEQKPVAASQAGYIALSLNLQGTPAIEQLEKLVMTVKDASGKVHTKTVSKAEIQNGMVSLVLDGIRVGTATVTVEIFNQAGAMIASDSQSLTVVAGQQTPATLNLGLGAGGIGVSIAIHDRVVGTAAQMQVLTSFERYLENLVSFANLSSNPSLFNAVRSFKAIKDLFPTASYPTFTKDGQGNITEATMESPDGKRVRLTFAASGIGGSHRTYTIRLVEAPDGSTGVLTLNVNATSWLPHAGLTLGSDTLFDGKLPDPMTFSADSHGVLEFVPAGNLADKISARVDLKDFFSAQQVSHADGLFIRGFKQSGENCYTYSDGNGGTTRYCYPIYDYSQPIFFKASDFPSMMVPARLEAFLSLPGFEGNLTATLSPDRRHVSLEGNLGRLQVDGKLRTTVEFVNGQNLITRARTEVNIDDPLNGFRFPLMADTSFRRDPQSYSSYDNSGYYHSVGYVGIANGGSVYGIRGGNTVAGQLRVVDRASLAELGVFHFPATNNYGYIGYQHSGPATLLLANRDVHAMSLMNVVDAIYAGGRAQLRTIGW